MLAIDVGKPACRAALWRKGETSALMRAAGEGTLGLAAPSGAAITETAILAVVKPLLENVGINGVAGVGVGAPGALADPTAARDLAERLKAALQSRSLIVASDAITSHAGALAGDPGVVLAAGTGAVAIAVGAHGEFHRIDGWGPWLGDAGGGAWLGFQGLRAVARARDGRGPRTALSALAAAQFGALEQLIHRLSAADNPAHIGAAFAPAVARAGEDNDAVALELLRAAALKLAQSVIAGAGALQDLDPIPIALTGGLLKLGPLLLKPLHAELERYPLPLRIRPARGSALDGARGLVSQTGGIHESRLVRLGEPVHQDPRPAASP